MTDEELSIINCNRHEVIFKPSETIFKTGGPLTHLICITKGMVKIYLEDTRKNKNIIIGIVKEGEMVGGAGFLVDNIHHFSVVAIEETTACFVKREDFEKVMESNAKFSIELVKYLNERIIRHYDKIISLTYKQSHGKVADTLLFLTNSIYQNDSFVTPLSRQDIADLSTISKESTIRILKEFVKAGVINCNTNRFEILDKIKLAEISKKG